MKQAVVVLAVLLTVYAYVQSASVDVVAPVEGKETVEGGEPAEGEKPVKGAAGGMSNIHHRQKRSWLSAVCCDALCFAKNLQQGVCADRPGYRSSSCCGPNKRCTCE
jgi:hypothetical protein